MPDFCARSASVTENTEVKRNVATHFDQPEIKEEVYTSKVNLNQIHNWNF